MGTRLYVSNLPLSATEAVLFTRFCQYGDIVSVALEPQKRAGHCGAFVEMEDSAAAHKAIAALNLSDFDGRLVSVYLALSSVQSTLKGALQ
jgi:RNA recognition motif-containing protein